MKRSSLMLSVFLLVIFSLPAFTASRAWRSGTLLETEKQEEHQGSIKRSNTEGTAKDRGNKTEYSQTTTSTTSEDVDTFQVYTIEDDTKTYIAREKLLFPWSKPANVSVGEKVKFAVEKNTLFILDDDGKEHKAGIKKVTLKSGQ